MLGILIRPASTAKQPMGRLAANGKASRECGSMKTAQSRDGVSNEHDDADVDT